MNKIGLNKINEIITEKVEQGYCIVILPASLGDTLLFYEYKKYIEKKHNLKIFCIVRRSQKFIPEYLNEKNFVRIDNLQQIFELDITNKLYPDAEKNLHNIGKLNPSLKKGHFFIAHTDFIEQKKKITDSFFSSSPFSFRKYQALLYDLNDSNSYDKNIYSLKPLQDKIEKGTILIANQASHKSIYEIIPLDFWIKIAKYFQTNGYNVVYNSKDRIKPLDNYAKWLDSSIDTCIQIALMSKKVISIRSGLCDLLHELGNKLHIIYPYKEFYDSFDIVKLFENSDDINEYIYSEENSKEILNKICSD